MPRAGLHKDTVVEAAATLLNTEGAEALTLNRLAQELGVKTPSLYNHVDGLPGLYRELALLNARTLGERFTQAAIGKSGPAALIAVAKRTAPTSRKRQGCTWPACDRRAHSSRSTPS